MLLPVLRLAVLSTLVAAVVAIATPVKTNPLEPVTVTQLRTDGAGGVSVDFTASSGGCTRAADFSIDVVSDGGGQHLRFSRQRPDLCEAYVPLGAHLSLQVTGLDVTAAPVLVDNPLFIARH